MWHEARKSEKKVHDMMDAARKRAQRRAIYLAKRRGDPRQSIQALGSRCRIYRDDALYQATEDQQGLIPWNGKQEILIDRFDGRALLDFIRDTSSRSFRAPQRTEEEEELEEFVNFERYRDLIKHRRRGFNDADGLQYVSQEMEAKIDALFGTDRPQVTQTSATKGPYSQVGFSYDGEVKDEGHYSDAEEDGDDEDEEDDFNSDDSGDEAMESVAKEFGVKRYGWLVYMDKKAKEEERRQKEVIKGDPTIRKLSRKERRKASQMEREKEREAALFTGIRRSHNDPYRESRRSPTYEAYSRSRRSRSKSRSKSPSSSRRHGRAPKLEYITEFGGSDLENEPKFEGYYSPPPPPLLNQRPSGFILEALHVDPASGVGVSLDKEKNNAKLLKTPSCSKLSKTPSSSILFKQGEKKETPQERLKRIMSKQLNKQIKKDTAAETAKKREQERLRLEKLAETKRLCRVRPRSRSRSLSPSPSRRYRRSRSRSYRRNRSRSNSKSRSPRRSRSLSRSRSPGVRRRSRY